MTMIVDYDARNNTGSISMSIPEDGEAITHWMSTFYAASIIALGNDQVFITGWGFTQQGGIAFDYAVHQRGVGQ